jgi:nucleotide-binding universal stress UspA family protein
MTLNVEVGQVVDEFIIGERLHAGAMGAVFRVSRAPGEGPLVMKVPRSENGDSGEAVIGFETEANILPTLGGPHVPRFVAAGDLARIPYLVSEWVEGPTLEEVLANGPQAPADVARDGAAIADALQSVHQQGVIHHDVKPANVILRGDGVAVLIDFGVARHARLPDLHAEETRVRAGSAPYVSPEVLLGSREDPRSDLFALGVVLYEALTGELPFGEVDTDVRNRFWLDPVPPSVRVPSVEPWLQEIVLRCLEPRAELRYQSAAQLAFDLRHPEQVVLTARARKTTRAGFVAHAQRFLRARAEHGARLRSPPALPHRTPIVLVAVDTVHLDDERHTAIRAALTQVLQHSAEYRLLCLTVIPPFASAQEHLVRLRHWAEPLRLPVQRLSLHAVEGDAPAEAIVKLAKHNSADVIVVGAPAEGARAWSQSVASTVTARAECSVHVIRVRKQ